MRRVRNTAGWLVATAILAVVPKCPLCLVALLAATGFGLSVAAASYLRILLILLCLASLLLFLIRRYHSLAVLVQKRLLSRARKQVLPRPGWSGTVI